jgi:tRNA(Ile)-lysidine synthase
MRDDATDAIRQVGAALAQPCAAPPGTPVVAACSGGADSTFLVHALSAHSASWPLVGVVFVDHGLRDITAEAGASQAAAQAAGVPWTCSEVTLDPSGNTQEQARNARYAALLKAAPHGTLVATGHTREDQAETVLQRLIRGSGLRGLSAISARDGRIIRPMLNVGRWAARNAGIPYAEDPSNATDRYQRNRIRHDVLPRLEVESAGAIEHLASLADRATEELEFIDALFDALSLSDINLGDLPPRIASLLVRWRGNRELPRGVRPGAAALNQAARLLVERAENASTSLGKGWAAQASSGRLTFTHDRDSRESLVLPCPGTYRLPHIGVELIPAHQLENDEPMEHNLNTWLRADKLRWPLKLTREPAREQAERTWALRDAPGALVWSSDQPDSVPDGDLFFRMTFSV